MLRMKFTRLSPCKPVKHRSAPYPTFKTKYFSDNFTFAKSASSSFDGIARECDRNFLMELLSVLDSLTFVCK